MHAYIYILFFFFWGESMLIYMTLISTQLRLDTSHRIIKIQLLNCYTAPNILTMMLATPKWPWMLRWRAHTSLHRTTLTGAATITTITMMNMSWLMFFPIWPLKYKPSCMYNQTFLVHKRNFWVTHWFFFVLSISSSPLLYIYNVPYFSE